MHLPFYITIFRFINGIRGGLKDPGFRALLVFVLVLLLTGTIFYSSVEGWRPLDALYFSVTTLTTIGFGDFAPKTDLGKIFTIFYIFVGVGTILSFITLVARHSRKSDPIHKRLSASEDFTEEAPVV